MFLSQKQYKVLQHRELQLLSTQRSAAEGKQPTHRLLLTALLLKNKAPVLSTPSGTELEYVAISCGLALRRVDLDEVLQFGGVARDRAAAVGFHVRVDAAVTENEAGGGEHRGVRAEPPAQRAGPAGGGLRSFFATIGCEGWRILLQVEGGRGSGQGGEGFHGALVV